jgi:hypothetical protein
MTLLVALAILAASVIPLAIAIARASELFTAEVRHGSVRLVRGRAPTRLLDDLQDVVARPRVRAATLRVVTEQGRPQLIARGELSETQLQQLRNVVGTWPVAKIRAGRRPR